MTTPAELGFATPVGSDMLTNGDDDITQNANASAAMYDTLNGQRWYRGTLGSGATITPLPTNGIYNAPTGAIAATIVGRPEGFVNPFTVEQEQLSLNNGINRQTAKMLTLVDGQWVEVVRQRYSLGNVFMDWVDPGTLWTRQNPVVVYGDSLSENGFPNYLAQHLSVTVTNFGRSGDTSNAVLLRAGVIDMHATPVGGSIPASGTVALNVWGRKLTTRDNRGFAMTFAGVLGTLTHTTGDAWTFTRTAPGTAVPITKPTRMISTQAMSGRSTYVFFFGVNDAWHGGHAPERDVTTHIAANYARATDAIAAQPEKHALILGMITSLSTVVDDALHKMVLAVNDSCATRAPHQFESLQEYMSAQCLTDIGLTPTPADTAAMTAGLIPPQLYADDLHFTQPAQEAIAQYFVAPALKSRGWA